MIRRSTVAGLALALILTAGCQKDAQDASAAANDGTAQAAVAGTRDWTTVVVATPDGGFMMGNPKAAVKLVEYGSLTCSHCAAFDAEGVPALKQAYVRTGKVSYEFRNFVRDPIDVTAALLSRCGGAQPYFKLSEQVFADQANIFQRFQTISDDEQKRIGALPQGGAQFSALAKAGGLDSFFAARGVPASKAQACLSNPKGLATLLKLRQVATDQYNLEGTPMFLINGTVVPNAASWTALEPALKAALG